MAVCFQLGKQQFSVDRKLKAASIRWNQGDRLDIRLEFIEQFGYQTGSTIGVMSDSTVDQVELQQHNSTSKNSLMNTPAGDATGVKSQLHTSGTVKNNDTCCPGNGGSSGTGYSLIGFTLQLRGPFSAGARAGFATFTAL